MQNSNRPTRFVLPFAQNDGSKVEIPVTTTDATRASLSLGFPPLTMTPPEAGGVPPQGEDFNGAMNQVARAVRWLAAGTFWPYDATFSGDTNVGGYPQGAIIQNSTFAGWLGSRVENNTTNPTAGQTGNWGPLTNAGYEIVMATGTAASLSLTDEQAASGYVRLTGTVFRNTSIVLPTTTGLNFSFIHDAANDTTAPTAVISVVDGYSNSVLVYPGQRVNFRTRNDGRLVAVSTGAAPNQFSSLQTVSGAATLPTTYAGALVLLTGASNYTVTLPLASTFAPGAPIDFMSESTAVVTIARQGTSDTITGNGSVSGLTSLVMYSGDKLTLVSDGTKWHAQAGTTAMQFATSQNNVKTTTTNTTLDGSYARITTVMTGSVSYNNTLPAANSVQPGTPFNFLSVNSATITLARAGADNIVVNNAGQTLATLSFASGDTGQLVSDGVSKWYLVDGSVQAYYARTVGSFPGVVGGASNLKVVQTSASSAMSPTANEIVVEDQLGGRPYVVASVTGTINIATTGANGMDTGSAPVSGNVGVYLIYNPITKAQAFLGVNATSAAIANIYAGANMPAGYTHSALISVWPTDSSGRFVIGGQTDRTVSLTPTLQVNTTTQQTSPTSVTITGGVPPNARAVYGYMLVQTTASSALACSVAATSTNLMLSPVALQNGVLIEGVFTRLPLITPQTVYYTCSAGSGTMTFQLSTTGYDF